MFKNQKIVLFSMNTIAVKSNDINLSITCNLYLNAFLSIDPDLLGCFLYTLYTRHIKLFLIYSEAVLLMGVRSILFWWPVKLIEQFSVAIEPILKYAPHTSPAFKARFPSYADTAGCLSYSQAGQYNRLRVGMQTILIKIYKH